MADRPVRAGQHAVFDVVVGVVSGVVSGVVVGVVVGATGVTGVTGGGGLAIGAAGICRCRTAKKAKVASRTATLPNSQGTAAAGAPCV